MARLVLDGVSKVYPGGVAGVSGLDLAIDPGELVVLVGPSGCGKSTTLRMVAGLEQPTSGTIRIGERVMNDVAPKDRDVAMVFQDYALYPHMTVYRNLAFGLGLRKVPRAEIEARVRAAARTLGLEPLLDRRPAALSGGQRQRVALGRAMVKKPSCFLFDEPLSNLDPALRLEMRAEIRRLQRSLGTTMMYVTHDQEEAMTLGDRVVVMEGGRVRQAGKPLELYRRPADRFVAGFLGTPPMNFLAGELAEGWFEAAGVRLRLPGREALGRRPAVLGLRPDALAPGQAGLHLMVDSVEPLGDRVDVRGALASGQRLIMRIDACDALPEPGPLEVQVDVARAHLFAADDGGAAL